MRHGIQCHELSPVLMSAHNPLQYVQSHGHTVAMSNLKDWFPFELIYASKCFKKYRQTAGGEGER